MSYSLAIKNASHGADGCLAYTSGQISRIIHFDVRDSLIDTDRPFLNKYLQNESITLWKLSEKDFDMINEYIRASYSHRGCIDFCANFSEFKARYGLHISERGNVNYMEFTCRATADVTAALLFYFGKSGWKLRRCAHCSLLFFSDAQTNEYRYCDRFSPMSEYENKTCAEAVKAALDDSYLRRSVLNYANKLAYEYAYNPMFDVVRKYNEMQIEHYKQRQIVIDKPTPDNIRAYQSWKTDFIKRWKTYCKERKEQNVKKRKRRL